MKVNDFIELIENCSSEGDWEAYEDNRYIINQAYVKAKDWDGLDNFYIEALKTVLNTSQLDKVLSYDFNAYIQALDAALTKVDKTLKDNDNLKVIYLEYEVYEKINSSFFICNRYSTEPWDDFPSDFELDNMIGIYPKEDIFFDYYEEFKLFENGKSGIHEFIRRYLDAKIVSSLGRVIDDKIMPVPVAMAEHDYQVIHYS